MQWCSDKKPTDWDYFEGVERFGKDKQSVSASISRLYSICPPPPMKAGECSGFIWHGPPDRQKRLINYPLFYGCCQITIYHRRSLSPTPLLLLPFKDFKHIASPCSPQRLIYRSLLLMALPLPRQHRLTGTIIASVAVKNANRLSSLIQMRDPLAVSYSHSFILSLLFCHRLSVPLRPYV